MKKVFITIFTLCFALPICAQEIGLQLYSLRNQFKTDIEGTLKTISDWGIDKVEGGDTYGMEEAEFRALLEKYNINVVGIGVDYNDLKKDLSAIADKADRYGAKYL
ncbi:MAG: sugar phosphate isomerase/epimerase, partial [Bacteroidia bacterium]|nr:sugar phosphate isomerase/epimerase [Bacteroidia bacterium]